MRPNKVVYYKNIFLVFLLVATTGMEYFYRSQNYILIGFIISSFLFIKEGLRIEKTFYITVILFLFAEIFQYLMFGGFTFRTFIGTYVRLFFAYSVIALVKFDFYKYYIKIIYVLSLISLVFYVGSFLPSSENIYTNILANVVPQIFESEGFYESRPNIVLFTFESTLFSDHRNSGPFWEPGAYGVFLVLALVINHIYNRSVYTRENIVFIICIITTLSTTAFICLAIYYLFYNYEKIKRNILYSIVFILFGILSIVLYEKIPFLKEKIENNIEVADETTSSRFGSAIADFNSFKRSPVFGLGRAGAKNDFVDNKFFEAEHHRNNGVFNLLATYGIIITVYYFYRIYLTFKTLSEVYLYSKRYAIFGFIIIMLLGFSQGIFMRPFFYGFLFVPMVFKTIRIKSNDSSYNNSNLQ